MVGTELGVDMHVVNADEAPLSNLELTINRCHLGVETVVATPYASGLAAICRNRFSAMAWDLSLICPRRNRSRISSR